MAQSVTAGPWHLLAELPNAIKDRSDEVLAHAITIAVIVVVAFVARFALHRMIDRLVHQASQGMLPGRVSRIGLGEGRLLGRTLERSADPSGFNRRQQRAKTVGTLLKSIVTGVIAAITITTVLAEVGVPIAPILASAGILGVAIGFGAQSLVKDFLSGVFMVVEDQYGVGDAVDLGEASGTVEAVSLRVTRLRDVNGTVWYVRNGEILRVGNQSQNWARTVLDVQVTYNNDLAQVREVLLEVAQSLTDDEDFSAVILEQPEVWGVQALDLDGATVRVAIKTAPMEQWRIARELRQRIVSRFEAEDIELSHTPALPYPHRGAESNDPDLGSETQQGQ